MKHRHHIFILFILLSLTSGLLFILPKQTYAEGSSLTVSPSLIRIQAKPPADVWTPFTVTNNSNQAVTLKIGYKTFDPQSSSNGTVVFLNDGQPIPGADKKIFQKMQIVDDQNVSHDTIDIGPKQQLRFRLRITLPTHEPVSDYYFSLIFLQKSSSIDQINTKNSIETQKSVSTIQAGIGINVLLSVGNKEVPQALIDNFSSPSFLDSGPVPFELSIHNSGNHFITPHGIILIKNLFGQTVGKVLIPYSIILAGTSRKITGTGTYQNASTAISPLNSTITKEQGVVWPEHFLLGMYTATLTLTLSNSGPVYTRTIHFISFPVMFSVEILLIVSLLIYIYLRVKRKLSDN